MAPYTMKINIKDPVTDVAYIGSARLPGDGYVTVTGRNCEAGSTTQGASLEKGGGHEGLFIATLFSIAGCLQNLLVWTSMSADSDGRVIVQLAFVDTQDASALPDSSYYKPETLGLTSGTAIAKGIVDGNNASYMAKLDHYDTTYPDATCTVSISHFSVAV
ncbi:hypothetical protein GGS20DRAFT_147938 [Poronia punctata]|nr:hypothetical protein GGS20DRAFT_147938 [Poronia punctata]